MSSTDNQDVYDNLALRAAIREISNAMALKLPFVDMLGVISRESRILTSAATIAVCILDEQELRFISVSGDRETELNGMRIYARDWFAIHVLQPDGPPTISVPGHAAAAIIVGGNPIGALCALAGETGPGLNPDAASILESMASLASASWVIADTDRERLENAGELRVLYQATDVVQRELNVQAVLDSVLDGVCSQLDYLWSAVFLFTDERTHLFSAAERGRLTNDGDVQLGADWLLVRSVIESRGAIIFEEDEGASLWEHLPKSESIRTVMAAPIRSQTEVLGLILVASAQPHNFKPNDKRLLEAVASQSGIAMSNAWLHENLMRRADETSGLFELSQRINLSLDLDTVLQGVADLAPALVGVEMFLVLLYDKASGQLIPRIYRGIDDDVIAELALPRPGEGIAGWVFEWETPQSVAEIATDPRDRSASLTHLKARSLICVPISGGEGPIGVMVALSEMRRLFTVGELELLYTVANQAATAISNARLFEQERHQSRMTRRYFHRITRALGTMIARAEVPRLFAGLALELADADACAIYGMTDDCPTPVVGLRRGSEVVLPKGASGTSFTRAVARRGKFLAMDTLAGAEEHGRPDWLTRERPASYLGVPLRIGRQVVGVLEVYSTPPRTFTRGEADSLAEFAKRARLAERVAEVVALDSSL